MLNKKETYPFYDNIYNIFRLILGSNLNFRDFSLSEIYQIFLYNQKTDGRKIGTTLFFSTNMNDSQENKRKMNKEKSFSFFLFII